MLRTRVLLFQALCAIMACVCVAPLAAASGDAPVRAAGTCRGAWFVVPGSLQRQGVWTVYHTGPESDLGTVQPVRRVFAAPAAVASRGAQLVLAFESSPPPRADAVPPDAPAALADGLGGWTFRSMRTTGHVGRGVYSYAPEGRLGFVAGLDRGFKGESLVGMAYTERGVAVLLWAGREASRLLLLDGVAGGWSPVVLPAGAAGSGSLLLTVVDGRLAVVAPGVSALWVLAQGGWERASFGGAAGAAAVVDAGYGTLIVASSDPAGAATVRLERVRSGRSEPLAQLDGVPLTYGLSMLGERVFVSWPQGGALQLRVVSPHSGETLYAGPAAGWRMNQQEIRGLVVYAVFFGMVIVFFLVRPGSPALLPVPPAGWRLASLGGRACAGGVDATVAVVVGAALWGSRWEEAVWFGIGSLVSGEIAPSLTAMGVFFAHGFLGECFVGRTLGKALCGGTVFGAQGARLAPGRVFVRNVVKAVFPPFTALLLVDPHRRHVGDLLSGSAVFERVK